MGIDVGKIRNVAVIAGGGAGKTSLVEAILYDTKAIERMGSIDTENTTTDFEFPSEDRASYSSSIVLKRVLLNHLWSTVFGTKGQKASPPWASSWGKKRPPRS